MSAETEHQTKAAILAAAEELFGEKGFAGVSARDVARRAGVNKALVFYHFGSMEDLFEAVLERYYAAQGAALAGAFEGTGDFRERVGRLLESYVDFIDSHRVFPRLVQQEVRRGGPAMERIQANVGALLEWAEKALGDALPRTGPLAPRHFYLTLGGMVIQYYAYAAALAPSWGSDPLGPAARRERRAHLRWVIDALLEKLEREAAATKGSRRSGPPARTASPATRAPRGARRPPRRGR